MNKVNGKIWRIFAISVVVIFAVLGVVEGYGRLKNRVENLETIAKKAEQKADIAAQKAETVSERVIRVEEGIDYLKQAVDRIEKKIE